MELHFLLSLVLPIFDTFCNDLLMMIWPSRVAVVLDTDRRDSLVISEVLCQAVSGPGLWFADNTKLTCRTHHSPFCREIELTAVVHRSAQPAISSITAVLPQLEAAYALCW